MTFRYTDPNGDKIAITGTSTHSHPAIAITVACPHANLPGGTVRIPLDQVEELIAGIRDTARQASRG